MQLPPNFCGIYQPTNDSTSPHTYLPLEHLAVHAKIVDVSAVVTLTQQFWQYQPTPTERAKYVFPVPSRAAVCGFEMRTQDGRVVKAVAKEKEQARREHNVAIQQGIMTGLVEHVTDDIFSISLGALPPSQIVTTKVTYVMDLMDADLTDQVRLQLPVCIGMRYGTPPEGMASPLTMHERVNISVDVAMKGPIASITSPTHSIGPSESPCKYRSDRFLEQDFVLIIKADGLNEPRCFAERHPTGSVAMQLTMVPKFDMPVIPAQEYIFLVDRSGSMQGDRIETAKKTLVMLLRALPGKGTMFNIFSFGSRCDSMSRGSLHYSEEALARATGYVDVMTANYGGTDIRGALSKVFRARSRTIPKACFLLTDGEDYEIDATLHSVAEAVAAAPKEAPLRVFTLGIGETVSTAICEGIARVGNGVCLMAATSESIIAKSAKLVRASRTHFLTNVSIDWGTDFTASADVTSQTDMLRQAPLQVPPLYSGNRFVVFTMLKHRDFVVPDKITIRAKQQGGEGEDVTFTVAVNQLPPPMDGSQPHLIHTLAARKIIQDIDDTDRNVNALANKSAIIHLGEQYQLASRFTSFIAVDNSGTALPPDDLEFAQQRETAIGMDQAHLARLALSARGGSASFGGSAAFGGYGSKSAGGLSQCVFGAAAPSASFAPPPPPPVMQQQQQAQVQMSMQKRSREVPMPMMAGMGSQAMSRGQGSVQASVALSQPAMKRARGLPPSAPRAKAPAAAPKPSGSNVDHGGIDADVIRLVRLQSFDGSFTPTAELEGIVGSGTLAEAGKLGVDKTVWATVLAVAYLQKYLKGQPELLEGLVEKAMDFINQPGTDFQELLDAAKLVVA